ncbi:MAG: DUF6603 domain-containing protein [Betaproteobacteria bacterium]
MPNTLGSFTDTLAARAVAIAPGSVASANALRTSGAALELAAANLATTENQWRAALADWRTKLTTLTQAAFPGGGPLALILDSVGYRLPPIPGIASVLPTLIPSNTPLDQLNRWRDDLAGGASLGPVELKVLIPAINAQRTGASAGDVLGFLPPSGLAINIDAGIARGGGSLSFSDVPHWRLAGSFGITLGVLSVSALGILERPGGTLSLVMLLGARFTPGIQLGFGFAISGVGGLIGVNRRADTDAMRARLASGAATDALFADDPAANAPAILETLGSIFVPAPGSFVVGPTMQLSWLKIGEIAFLRVDVGVFIELPGPARIVLVGRAIAEVPAPGVPLLHFQIDVIGEIDFVKSLLSIRASLVNSQALGIFRAAGDAVLITCWGSPPYQVLSVGGFYPGFNPAPAVVAPMRRIALSTDFDYLPGLWLRFEAYVAVTSNTFQVGGRLELGINIGITAQGYVSLDALFQFQPFHYEVEIHGGLRVGVLGTTFAGVDVSGRISGPGPNVIDASISIDLWLVEFSWSDTFTIGAGGGQAAATIDLVPELAKQLVPANLRARGGADALIALKPAPATGVALVSPLGTIVFSQRIAPLNLPLERFGGLRLGQPTTAAIAPTSPGVTAGAVEPDYFAPGTYMELSVAEALNQPPFDRLDSGFELAFGAAEATAAPLAVAYRNYYRGRPLFVAGVLLHFDNGVLGLMGGRRAAPAVTDRSALVTVKDEPWVTRAADGTATPASSRTAAHVAVRHGRASVALPAADSPVSLAAVA